MQNLSFPGNDFLPEKKALRKVCSRIGWMCLSTNLLVAWLATGITLLFLWAGYPFGSYPGSIAGYHPYLYYAMTCGIYLFCLLVPLSVYAAANRVSWSSIAEHRKNGCLVFWCSVVFGLSFCLLGTLPTNFTGWAMQELGLLERSYGGSSPFGNDLVLNLLYIFSSTVIPAFSEELFFRGLILNQLRKYGSIFAILMSSLLFSLYHMSMPQMVFTFFMGLALGAVMLRTHNIWAVMLIHALTNGVDLLNSHLISVLGYSAGIAVKYSIIALFFLLGLASIFFLLKRDLRFFRRQTGITRLKVSTRLGAFLFNPGIIAMTLGLVVMELYYWLR